MPRKNAFRGPEAKTFQLLHRSLRDPEINNPDASERILSEVVKGKGKGRAVNPDSVPFEKLNIRDNEGEAANYGIVYDDTEYDYMQHLRATGTSREAVFIEAPPRQAKRRDAIVIPDEALPAHPADERDYNELVGIPDRAYGLQPDLDPNIRETLEALDDDAFVDHEWAEQGEEGDDFFEQLVQGEEDGHDEEWEDEDEGTDIYGEVERYKAPRILASPTSDLDSEGGDTVGELLPSKGERPPRAPASLASGFSMSSSSMFRNQGLQNLDEQFDEIEREYADDDSSDGSLGSEAPDLLDFTLFDPTEKRTDLDGIMDDFLARYEVLGGKLRPAFEGLTASAKLDTLRRELREGTVSDGLHADEKSRILAMADSMAIRFSRRKEQTELVPIQRYEDKFDRWDCETVLSTYSNLENHPRLLSAKGFVEKREPRIRLDPRTGMPIAPGVPAHLHVKAPPLQQAAASAKQTVTRPRNESVQERKERKQAVKAERQERRAEKKTVKESFSDERKRQQRTRAKQMTRAADVNARVDGPAVIRLS